jgi:hypothetical protein
MPTTQEIINHFHTLTDDDTTLSEDEELVLANKSYRKVLSESRWPFLIKRHTATQSTTVPYIDLPDGFKSFAPVDGKYTAFIGDSASEYPVISIVDSINYDGYDGRVYLDLANSRLQFTKQPTEAKSVDFFYIYRPNDLELDTEPVFPSEYHYMISHDMVTDSYISDQTPKGRTYYSENMAKYDEILQRMKMDYALMSDYGS